MKSRSELVGWIALLSLLAAATTVFGQTYEWTDSGGVVHFTDNPELVPRSYRGTVRIRDSVRGEEKQLPQKQRPTPGTLAGPPRGEPLYGGKPFSWWQTRYRDLAAERQGAATHLDELKVKEVAVKRKKTILQRASDRTAVKEVQEEISRQEELIKGVEERIGALETDALRAGVPARWREQP